MHVRNAGFARRSKSSNVAHGTFISNLQMRFTLPSNGVYETFYPNTRAACRHLVFYICLSCLPAPGILLLPEVPAGTWHPVSCLCSLRALGLVRNHVRAIVFTSSGNTGSSPCQRHTVWAVGAENQINSHQGGTTKTPQHPHSQLHAGHHSNSRNISTQHKTVRYGRSVFLSRRLLSQSRGRPNTKLKLKPSG